MSIGEFILVMMILLPYIIGGIGIIVLAIKITIDLIHKET